MKAHELAMKLLGGPDVEVVIVDDMEWGRNYWTVDEVIEVDKKPKDSTIDAPFVELQ